MVEASACKADLSGFESHRYLHTISHSRKNFLPSLVKRLEHLVPSLSLRIPRIFDFQPPMLGVDAGLSLCHDPLKIPFANFFEQQLTVALDVLRVNDLGAVAAFDQSSEFLFSFNERGLPQIGIVQSKKIECEKDGAASPIQQLFELAHTAGIEGDDLAVENGALCSQSGQSFPQDFKTFVGVSSARD